MTDSERLAKGLRCIRNQLAHAGRAPSVRELARCMGFSSPRSASVLIDDMVDAGLVAKRSDGRLQLLEAPHHGGAMTVAVPVVGSAPCGGPLLAEENIEGVVRVDARLAKPPYRYFILHAEGNSMDLAGIADGDLALVRSTPHAQDGDRVVALVDGESTIKILRQKGGVVALEPRSTNKTHKPIYAASDLVVQGVVVATLPGSSEADGA